jgi:hypothetical protein
LFLNTIWRLKVELIAIMDDGMLLVRIAESKQVEVVDIRELTLMHPLVTDVNSFRLGIAYALVE